MRRIPVLVTATLALVAALVLSSCSSSKAKSTANSSGTGPTSVTSPAGSTTASGTGTAVAVTESEFSITMPSKTLAAGTYTFNVMNNGTFSHNLTVNGPGVDNKATSTLSPGDTGEVTVTLQKGSYEFYCSVDGHKDKGMDVTVQVT